jgi:hypothetical protein
MNGETKATVGLPSVELYSRLALRDEDVVFQRSECQKARLLVASVVGFGALRENLDHHAGIRDDVRRAGTKLDGTASDHRIGVREVLCV